MTKINPLSHSTAFSDHDKRRFNLVAPPDWENPNPQERYHLVVLGAGAAGLITAAGAAGLGAKVALIEKEHMGGDCLNVGCVPSKGVISASKAFHAAAKASAFGVSANASIDFSAAMERMRRIRADISKVDSADRFQNDLNVDVFIGKACFLDNETVQIDDQTKLKFKKAVIATGGRAAVPPIEGLDQVGYRTNHTIFDLQEKPERLFVIGAGPIGCELAQAFCRFQCKVTIADMSPKILNNDDEDAAAIVKESMEKDGVIFKLGVTIKKVEEHGNEKHITLVINGQEELVIADEILICAGRIPNTEGLNLEKIGVDYDRRGVKVDERLRTTNKKIFACGDICSPYQFTHIADASARIVIQNALFFGRKKFSDLVIPWATYTSPELAHVGQTKAELNKKNIPFDEYKVPMDDVDRALLEGDDDGFITIYTQKGGDKILGATIVSSHAGELISEITLAIRAGKGLGFLASVIHPYPTAAEAIRKAGDAYNRTKLTAFAAFFLKLLLKL